jgi:pentatricopeptide repeat protein
VDADDFRLMFDAAFKRGDWQLMYRVMEEMKHGNHDS